MIRARSVRSVLLPMLALLLVGMMGDVRAQGASSRTQAGLEWRVHSTEHFRVHFPMTRSGTEEARAVDGSRVARRVGVMAEQFLAETLQLLPAPLPTPVHIVLDAQLDRDAALARPEWNTLELSTHPGPYFPFRDRGDWLRERLAHELAHLILTAAISPFPPATAAQVDLRLSSRSGISRVIGADPTGNPTGELGLRFPISDGTPFFWLEGGAEYLAGLIEANRWEASRDMMLRMSTLEDLILSPTALLSGLGKTGLDGERAYNQGHAFLLFLRERYGEDSFTRIVRAAARQPRFSWLDAVEEGQGIPFDLLYARYREWLTARYQPVAMLKQDLSFGEELDLAVRPWRSPDLDVRRRWMALPQEERQVQREGEGLLASYPAWSPDGRLLAYWEDGLKVRAIPEVQWSAFGGRPLDALTDRLELSRRERRVGTLGHVRRYPLAWSPDGKRLAVVAEARSRADGPTAGPADWNAIYLLDVRETERGSVQLSVAAPGTPVAATLRGQDPAWSPDGRWLSFVRHADGTANLWIVRPDGTDPRPLTRFNDNTDLAHPSWSPDSRQVVFEMYRQNQRDLWILDVATGGLLPIMLDASSDVTPCWGRDGKIYFSSDASGTFNLYSYDLSTLEVRRLTDVLGGAFMPTLTPRGNLTYVHFDGYSLKLFGLQADRTEDVPVDNQSYLVDPSLAQAYLLGAQESPAADSVAYRPLRSGSRVVFVPTLSIGTRSVAVGGAALWKDPLSQHALRLQALGGFGSLLEARYDTTRVGERAALGMLQQLVTQGTALRIGEGDDAQTLERQHQLRLRAGYGQVQLPLRERLKLTLSADLRARHFRDEGSATLRPLHLSAGGGAELRYSSLPSGSDHGLNGIDPRDGALLRLRYQLRESRVWDPLAGGAVQADGESIEAALFHRIDFELLQAVALPWQAHTLEWQLNLGTLSRNVAWWDELKAGGRMEGLEPDLDPFVAFPGYTAESLSGETLAVLSLAYRLPLVDRLEHAWGPLYLDAVYAQLGGSFGNVWGHHLEDGILLRESPLEGPASRSNPGTDSRAFLSEVGLELRSTATLFQRYRWGGFFHVGYALDAVTGLGDVNRDESYPGLYGDILPQAGGELEPPGLRFALGLGAGF